MASSKGTGLTGSQWMIISVLAVGVVLMFCFIGLAILGRIKASEFEAWSATATLEAMAHPSDTPTARPTRTAPPPATATPTFVLSRNRPRATEAPHTPIPGPLQDAWVKTERTKNMRFELDLSFTGFLASQSGIPGYKDGDSLMYLGGDMTGNDSHIVVKGFLLTELNMDPNKGLEMMLVGDRSYLRGPQPILGALEDKWYYGPRNVMAAEFDSPDLYRNRNPDWQGLKKVASDSLDGTGCDVYQGGAAETYRFFNDFSTSGPIDEDSFALLDRAETRIWICQDGFTHQMLMTLERHAYGSPASKGDILMRVHFYDMDKQIKIIAPTGAAPLPPRSRWSLPTPFPTATPKTF